MPKPCTVIFKKSAKALGGRIPGPIRVDVVGDTIWAAGGHDFSGVFRYADGTWHTTAEVEPLLNFVVGVSDREAIIGGAGGMVGRTIDGGASWTWKSLGSGWLICASRDDAGRIWIGHEGGKVWRAVDARAPFETVAKIAAAESVNAVRQATATHGLVVTECTVHRIELATGTLERVFEVEEGLIDGVADPRGRIVIVASEGRGWIAEDGVTFAPIADLRADESYNFDAVFWVGDRFAALGYDGKLRMSRDGHTWKRITVETKVERLGGIAPYKGGWLVGALRMVDGDSLGGLTYVGDPANAPLLTAD